jgi:signal transduction histidine kinase
MKKEKKSKEQLDYFSREDSLKRFAAKVAHDFNNILTGVAGFAQLILMEMKEDDEFYKDIKEIDSASKKGKALTNKLLLFSQERTITKKEADINKIVTESVEEIKLSISPDIVITTDLSEMRPLSVDKEEIAEALKYIFMNSAEAMEHEGKIDITSGEKGQYALISVTDTGKGAGSKDLPFIFEPFYRTKKMRMSGVELAIVREIINRHGGEIEAASHRNEGLTLKIRLPLSQPADA